jgi:hypothetical protein
MFESPFLDSMTAGRYQGAGYAKTVTMGLPYDRKPRPK